MYLNFKKTLGLKDIKRHVFNPMNISNVTLQKAQQSKVGYARGDQFWSSERQFPALNCDVKK